MRITEMTLADYVEGCLARKDRMRVERHLHRCRLCLEEVSVAEEAIRKEACAGLHVVPEEITRRAIAAVRRERRMGFKWREMVSDWLVLKPNGLAPIRGSRAVLGKNLILVKKSFQHFQAEIVFENLGESRASIKVKPSEGVSPGEPLRATLQQNGREVSSYLMSESGVCFEDVPFGPYRLVFTRSGRKVGEYPFELEERSHGRK